MKAMLTAVLAILITAALPAAGAPAPPRSAAGCNCTKCCCCQCKGTGRPCGDNACLCVAAGKPRVVGDWVMSWASSLWSARLDGAGRYWATAGETQYEGTWHLLGDHLVIKERRRWPPPAVYLDGEAYYLFDQEQPWSTITIKLEPGALRSAPGGMQFELRKAWE